MTEIVDANFAIYASRRDLPKARWIVVLSGHAKVEVPHAAHADPAEHGWFPNFKYFRIQDL